jgi:hypothetical protein
MFVSKTVRGNRISRLKSYGKKRGVWKKNKKTSLFCASGAKNEVFSVGRWKKVPLALFPFFSTQTVGLAPLRETKMRRDWLRIFD